MLNYRNQIIEVKHLSTVFGEKTVDEAFASYDGQMVPVLIVRNTSQLWTYCKHNYRSKEK